MGYQRLLQSVSNVLYSHLLWLKIGTPSFSLSLSSAPTHLLFLILLLLLHLLFLLLLLVLASSESNLYLHINPHSNLYRANHTYDWFFLQDEHNNHHFHMTLSNLHTYSVSCPTHFHFWDWLRNSFYGSQNLASIVAWIDM